MIVTSINSNIKEYKIAWVPPDQNTASQIHHIIIKNANQKGTIENVKSMRSPNIDLGHFLIKAVIKKN
jgi:hypothetical protein